jgi:putative transposase
MTDAQALVKTLDFQLDIQSDNESLLYDATLEARSVYNETIRLAKQGVDWDAIPDRVADDANLVKNTTQRVVAKALGAMENDDSGRPSHTKDGAYPLRANDEEGYNLSLTDDGDGDVALRISAKPYKHVTGVLKGSDAHLNILETALESDEWKIRTAEALFHNDNPELTSTSPTPNRPFETSRIRGRSSVWT